jgi:hypothetical protein
MSDALPLPPRPNLEQYRKLAKDLQRACRSTEPRAIRDWAADWVSTLASLRRRDARRIRAEVAQHWWDTPDEVARAAGAIERQWQRLTATPP